MKHEITGWIANGVEVADLFWIEGSQSLKEITLNVPVWAHRGKKDTWDNNDWPPKRIKITVEDD